jgi:hypothetical protein
MRLIDHYAKPLETIVSTPSLIPKEELAEVARFFAKPDHVLLTDSEGRQIEVPEVLLQHFARIVRMIVQERKAIVTAFRRGIRRDAGGGKLPRRVAAIFGEPAGKGRNPVPPGRHTPQVTFKDLLEYERKRNQTRRAAMDRLSDEVANAGLLFLRLQRGLMRADFDGVLIDACVLANHGVCDLLLRLAERPRLFVPHWTAKILRGS